MKKQIELPPPPGLAGAWVRYGNTALTILLFVLAGVLFLRWRLRSNEVAKQGVADQLAAARDAVRQVQPNMLMARAKTPADLIAEATKYQQAAAGRVTDAINAAGEDGRTRAAALLLRGDLNWNLANLPPLPGAASDPALRLVDPPEVLLKHAGDAYAEALSAAGGDPGLTGPAHLGLAAVAENRGDWDAARTNLSAVTDETKSVAVLADRARAELAELPSLQHTLYLDLGSPTTGPTTAPAQVPVVTPLGVPLSTVNGPMPDFTVPSPTTVPAAVVTPASGPTTAPTGR